MPNFFPPLSGSHPLGGVSIQYYVHEAEETTNPRRYGYIDHRGAWIIMQQNTDTGSHRYATGKTDFATNWTNRASLSYDYFNNVV